MVSASQIREKIIQLLDARIELDDFEDWIVLNTWNIHLSGSAAAESLAFAVEESLAEHSSGHITIDGLRAELLDLVERENIIVTVAHISGGYVGPMISWRATSSSPTAWVPSARS